MKLRMSFVRLLCFVISPKMDSGRKYLNGRSKEVIMEKRRTRNFREDETSFLIELWSNPIIQEQINASHRKDPIMRRIASAMQQRGFFRNHEEIKTRLRNLKCMYYRIKKSKSLGMFCPYWPHFEAMDSVLGNSTEKGVKENKYLDGIKQERESTSASVDGVDSFSTTYEDGRNSGPSVPSSPQQTVTSSTHFLLNSPPNFMGTVSSAFEEAYDEEASEEPRSKRRHVQADNNEVATLLRQLLDVSQQHLALEKQRLEFDRLVGTQLMALIPMMGSIIQGHLLQQNRIANTFVTGLDNAQYGAATASNVDGFVSEDAVEESSNDEDDEVT